MPRFPFRTNETVAAETFAVLAISLIVAVIVEAFPRSFTGRVRSRANDRG
jgi:hypothetical protein